MSPFRSNDRCLFVCCFLLSCLVTELSISTLQASGPQVLDQSHDVPAQEESTRRPQVILEEAGQSPLRTLRLRPTKGSQQRHELTMAMTMGSEANGQKSPEMKIPTVKYTMDSSITDVASNGDVAFTVEYVAAKIVEDQQASPDMIAGMEQMMASIVGLQFKSTVDQRGFSKGVTIELPDGMDPGVAAQIDQLSKSVEQLTSPFPAEAVGVGAKWKLVTPIDSGGMKFIQTARYTVVEMTEDTVTATLEISQDADEQDMDLSDSDGMKVRLISLDCRGRGRMTLHLAAIFSNEASVKADVTVKMIVDSGQEVELTQEVSTEVQLKAIPRSATE